MKPKETPVSSSSRSFMKKLFRTKSMTGSPVLGSFLGPCTNVTSMYTFKASDVGYPQT